MKTLLLLSIVLMSVIVSAGDIQLPPPVREGGKPLLQTLNERKTGRAFAERELSAQTLSSLLWAANGLNRADGRRTAPTGMNVQDIDVYVMTKAGVYLYDAKANCLKQIGEAGDYRVYAGKQEFAQKAPFNLFFVQDTTKSMKGDESSLWRYGGIHAGAIMQNVYLFCAHEGLSAVARGYLDYETLPKILKLKTTQRLLLGQSVGYPL